MMKLQVMQKAKRMDLLLLLSELTMAIGRVDLDRMIDLWLIVIVIDLDCWLFDFVDFDIVECFCFSYYVFIQIF